LNVLQTNFYNVFVNYTVQIPDVHPAGPVLLVIGRIMTVSINLSKVEMVYNVFGTNGMYFNCDSVSLHNVSMVGGNMHKEGLTKSDLMLTFRGKGGFLFGLADRLHIEFCNFSNSINLIGGAIYLLGG
jgi:hypothetical protein